MENISVRARLSALASFFRYLTRHWYAGYVNFHNVSSLLAMYWLLCFRASFTLSPITIVIMFVYKLSLKTLLSFDFFRRRRPFSLRIFTFWSSNRFASGHFDFQNIFNWKSFSFDSDFLISFQLNPVLFLYTFRFDSRLRFPLFFSWCSADSKPVKVFHSIKCEDEHIENVCAFLYVCESTSALSATKKNINQIQSNDQIKSTCSCMCICKTERRKHNKDVKNPRADERKRERKLFAEN